MNSMEGWDAWEERGLRIGYEAILAMLEDPSSRCRDRIVIYSVD